MSAPRTRPPAHQNSYAWRHNMNSGKTAKILAIPNVGLCKRCHDIIEWRKQFRKYKPLSKPHKCNACNLPKVKAAYHHMCPECSTAKNVCPKCLESKDIFGKEEAEVEAIKAEIEKLTTMKGALPGMSERERRALVRDLERKVDGDKKKRRRPGHDDDEPYDEAYAAEYLDEEDEESGDEEEGDDDEDDDEEEDEVAAVAAVTKSGAPMSYEAALKQADEVGDILTRALAAAKKKSSALGTSHPPASKPAIVSGDVASAEAAPADPWELQERLRKLVVVPKELPKKAVASGEAGAGDEATAEAPSS